MANAYKLYEICKQCGGSGLDKGSGLTCKSCDGAKVKLIGYCTEAVYDIPEVE
jgi:DnaJ-class molecular chaperone